MIFNSYIYLSEKANFLQNETQKIKISEYVSEIKEETRHRIIKICKSNYVASPDSLGDVIRYNSRVSS